MIICFDKTTKEITTAIYGNNPIAPYDPNISYLEIPNKHFLIQKGDRVIVDNKTAYIGNNRFDIDLDEYTFITQENWQSPVLLEIL